jgi:UbiD family decarboxylase
VYGRRKGTLAYRDLRDYLKALYEHGLLRRVRKEVDPEWEIAAVCRVAFQRLSPYDRPAILFEKVKEHQIPVLVGAIGGSRSTYGLALGIPVEDLTKRVAGTWAEAISHPLEPRVVSDGPCKENIIKGDEINLFAFPHPVWTVGQDAGYFFTAPYVVSKDPRTGIRNVGTYRLQIKGKAKTGIHLGKKQHLMRHIYQNEATGLPTPVAIVVGADPTIGLVSVTRVPYESDELAVAGALRGEQVELVKCETNDLEVPATAEIVIEGEIPPGEREREGPFGEHTGYMCPVGEEPVVQVTCITHRNNPIYQAFLSQKPPSESSLMRSIGRESTLYAELTERLGLPVTDVHFKESGGAGTILVISMKKEYASQVWETVWGAWAAFPDRGKITIVVDDDVDIRDPFDLEWAISFRMQPARDIHIVRDTPGLTGDPSVAPWGVPTSGRHGLSKLVIDATKKHEYPPPALPPVEHLERVRAHWGEYGIE